MTPLLTALSSCREATRSARVASSTLPASAASRNLRTLVRSADLTALLRWRAFAFCLLRLICDLMFATRNDPSRLSLLSPARGTVCPPGRQNEGANMKDTDSAPAPQTSPPQGSTVSVHTARPPPASRLPAHKDAAPAGPSSSGVP